MGKINELTSWIKEETIERIEKYKDKIDDMQAKANYKKNYSKEERHVLDEYHSTDAFSPYLIETIGQIVLEAVPHEYVYDISYIGIRDISYGYSQLINKNKYVDTYEKAALLMSELMFCPELIRENHDESMKLALKSALLMLEHGIVEFDGNIPVVTVRKPDMGMYRNKVLLFDFDGNEEIIKYMKYIYKSKQAQRQGWWSYTDDVYNDLIKEFKPLLKYVNNMLSLDDKNWGITAKIMDYSRKYDEELKKYFGDDSDKHDKGVSKLFRRKKDKNQN